MLAARANDLPWRAPRIFKPAYFAGEDLVEVANAAYQMYVSDNALYGNSAFPSIGRYEREVVGMLLELMDAPPGAGGSITGGGTESNMMAVKAARDWAREAKPRATAPEMVLPRTAHPSFEKAAHMFGVKPVRMAASVDWRADVAGMAAAINENTVMIVGSAPPYPYGTTDPIAALSALAERHRLWLHTDACLGGFILPFARRLGREVPDFDFALPGVTSISIDAHKFGYCNKGVSILLLRDAALERFQRTSFEDWPSGMYSTPNIIGSRSGGAIASAWAVMNYLGLEGYQERVRVILSIRDRLFAAIRAAGLEIIGEPDAYNFAFTGAGLDMHAVADALESRGWTVGRANEPSSIQLMVNRAHDESVEDFGRDLNVAVDDVRAGRVRVSGAKSVYAV
jgi:glutamate/tyrosine decarboxylase-like PLP-dependent enzyme